MTIYGRFLKRICALAVVAAMLFTGFGVTASYASDTGGVCGEGLTWSYDSATGTLTIEGTGDMTDYNQEKLVPWYSVRRNITNLEISSGVTHIGKNTLSGLSSLQYNSYEQAKYLGNSEEPYLIFIRPDSERLSSVTFHESTTIIYDNAFCDCVKLASVELPEHVVEIGSGVFGNCARLKSISLPEGLLHIQSGAFGGCVDLEEIALPRSLTDVGSGLFRRCASLSSVIFPNGITELPSDMFKDCSSLVSVSIPVSVTMFGGNLFSGCTSLDAIYYGGTEAQWTAGGASAPDGVRVLFNSICGPTAVWTADGGVMTITGTGELYAYGDGGAPWYPGRDEINEIFIKKGVASIGVKDFAGMTAVTKVTIPNSVLSIGESAFAGCASLSEVFFAGTPEEWASVEIASGNEALSLANIIFIDFGSVENIDWIYYREEKSLVITGAGGMPDLSSGAPWDVYKKEVLSVSIGEGITSLGSGAFSGMTALVSASIPNSIRAVGGNAFASSSSLQYNKYNRVNYLGNDTNPYLVLVSSTERITSYEVHPDTKIIAEYAFCDSTALRSITFPDGLLVIENSVFANCPKLTALDIPASVINIGAGIAAGCTSISSLTVDPANAVYRSGGNCVIERATGTVILGCGASVIPDDGSVVAVGDLAFRTMSKMTSIAIPDSVGSIGAYAFAGCRALEAIELPDGVTSIGNNAFDGCAAVTSFTVPLGVTAIAENVFSNCASLSSVTLHSGVKSIGAGAFYCCTSLSTVYYDGTEAEFAKIKVDTASGKNYNFLNASVRFASNGENSCGDNVTWSFDEGLGILYITGEGAMYDYQSAADLPWNDKRDGINAVSVGSGVTSVSPYSFAGCPDLKTVFIAKTVSSIGNAAFDSTASLSEIRFGGTAAEWQNAALGDAVPAGVAVFFTDGVEFSIGDDEKYSFANSKSHYDKTYVVTDEDFLKLCNYVRILYKDDAKNATSIINSLQKTRASEWGGSCYGMAVTTILDKRGQIGFNENFCPDAASLYDVVSPLESVAVESAINYYHISQNIPYLRAVNCTTFRTNTDEWRSGLYGLVEEAKLGEPILFTYSFNKSGHAIVIKGYAQSEDGGHIIYAYDNRYPKRDVLIKIDRNFNSCTVNNTEVVKYVEYARTTDFFDVIDIDGPDNDYASYVQPDPDDPTPPVTPDNTAEITIKASGRVTVENAEGERSVFENGELTGFIDAEFESFGVDDGEDESLTFSFTVADSASFTFIPECGDLYAAVLDSSIYASAETVGAGSVVISGEDGVSATGESVEYKLALSVNDGVCDMIQTSGASAGAVSLSMKNGVVRADGVDTDNGRVTVYSNTVKVDNYELAKGYSSFAVVELSGEPGDVAIMGSSREDGVYDVNIGIRSGECDHTWVSAGSVVKATLTSCGTEAFFCEGCGAVRLDHVTKYVARVAGDANADGILSAKDVLFMRRWFAGLDEPDEVSLARCDINGDGESDYKDILKLRKHLAGLE